MMIALDLRPGYRICHVFNYRGVADPPSVYFRRATEAAHWWSDGQQILAGRDLAAGGTWLGITRSGRFAALTNYRSSQQKRANGPSRGTLVCDTLRSEASIEDDLAHLQRVNANYSRFNMLVSDGQRLGIYESARGTGAILGPGVYGLSNHLLDTPWPKVQNAKSKLREALNGMDDPASALELLRDDRPAPDAELPRTGVSIEWERLLSSAFVRGNEYGTRSSTVIRIDVDRRAYFDEWSWNPSGSQLDRRSFEFTVVA
jgi:uncharacterized protein with NRDE domain